MAIVNSEAQYVVDDRAARCGQPAFPGPAPRSDVSLSASIGMPRGKLSCKEFSVEFLMNSENERQYPRSHDLSCVYLVGQDLSYLHREFSYPLRASALPLDSQSASERTP